MGVSISTGRLVAFGLTELNTPHDLSRPYETSVNHLPPFGLNSENAKVPVAQTMRFFLNSYVTLLGPLKPPFRCPANLATDCTTEQPPHLFDNWDRFPGRRGNRLGAR